MEPNKDSTGILGGAFGFGQKKLGVELAPKEFRNKGFISQIRESFPSMVDFGDICDDPNLTEGELYFHLHSAVLKMTKICGQNLIFGGDHSISLGTVSALLKSYPNLSVIWVDAHADMNTPETSPTGNLHGMPLAGLMGLFDGRSINGMEWFEPCLRPEKLALVGVRDLDDGEKEFIEKLHIKAISADEVHDRGMKSVMAEVLQHVDPLACNPIHLSFDIDSMDPSIAPATGIPVPKGLATSQIVDLGNALAETRRLVSAEFVEINPFVSKNEVELILTMNIVSQLINSLAGGQQQQLPDPQWKKNLSWPARGWARSF